MADYIIGGILVALAILALRSVFKKTSSGGCAGCSGCNGCRLLTNHFKKHII